MNQKQEIQLALWCVAIKHWKLTAFALLTAAFSLGALIF